MTFDLLQTVDSGGCSAKLGALHLEELLKQFPIKADKNIIVGTQTQDDAGVYKINDETALVFTTDFFPPVCSDPYDFGMIAAANSLSDIYAMGAKPLLALNLMMFPDDKLPEDVYISILKGGNDKVNEAGAIIIGGHTISDAIPKYGLAAVGTVNPQKVITNSGAKAGDKLILTKPIGTGIAVSGKKAGIVAEDVYNTAVNLMCQLNKEAAEIMQKFDVTGATDITGFGMLGHSYKFARHSNVSFKLYSANIPVINGIYELAEYGCLPGASFRNLRYVENDVCFAKDFDYNMKMILCDAQTSGGMLISVSSDKCDDIIKELKQHYIYASVIGEVIDKSQYSIFID